MDKPYAERQAGSFIKDKATGKLVPNVPEPAVKPKADAEPAKDAGERADPRKGK